MSPFFRGPRQMTASSALESMKPIDITPRLSDTYTGDHPALLWCTSSPSRPSILGMLGPHMSMSRRPTCAQALAWFWACAAPHLLSVRGQREGELRREGALTHASLARED